MVDRNPSVGRTDKKITVTCECQDSGLVSRVGENPRAQTQDCLTSFTTAHLLLSLSAMAPRSNARNDPASFIRHCLYHPARRRLTLKSGPRLSSTSNAINAPVATAIPPESPRFIPIPRPIQPQAILRPWVKGVLPVPRKIFPKNGPDKASPKYLASATPEPLPHNVNKPRDARTAEFVNYKARQAEGRRNNLRESLIELRFRKERTDATVAGRSRRKQAFNRERREAPEREDERLTNATILQSDIPRRHTLLPDPNREARLALKRDNVARHSAAKEEERRRMLHNLYVNAGSFITTGSQLDQAVDEVFDDMEQFATSEKLGVNIWNLGFPETVQEMLGGKAAGSSGGKSKALESALGTGKELLDERMREVGKELTGGKTDVDDQSLALRPR